MYYRHFKVTEGPLIDELKRLFVIRKENHAGLVKLADEIGSTGKWIVYDATGTCAGFSFDKNPDPKVWREASDHAGYYVPRLNTNAGKEMRKRIDAIPKRPNFNDALTVIGVSEAWIPVDASRMACAGIRFASDNDNIAFIAVPWRDEDPAKLEQYKKDMEEDKRWDMELDHLLWTPHETMVEIKKWEMDKYIAEVEERKAAAKEQSCQN